MGTYKLFAVALIALITVILLPGSRGQQRGFPPKPQQKVFDENRFPIADFSAAEPSNPVELSKRRARGQKYDKSDWGVNPNSVSNSTVRVDFVDPKLPVFPLNKSKAVVMGRVMDARAYLSNDKTGIYSVFAVLVEEVLANLSKVALTNGSSIEAEREGGRVKFPSGRVHLYMVSELNMPRAGERYVFFLSDGSDEPVFQIITAYELRDGLVHPLDQLPHLQAYENMSETKFLSELKTKILNP